MSEAFQEGGGGGISIKAKTNENFQYEISMDRDLGKGERSVNVEYLSKNNEKNEETSHLMKNHKALESDNPESSKQFAESSNKNSKKELSEIFSSQTTSKAENNAEGERSSEKKFGKIESIDKFLSLHFNPFTIEEEFIDINNFDSKDIEKRALDLDVLDASETPVNYKYNRTQNQSTRGYWNKKKEGVEAQLEQQENEANNGEDIDSDEESVPVKEDLISQVENMKFL